MLIQAGPGHKRAPSDASVASSEDDKVPPTPSALTSVTEKVEAEPTEDRNSDKLSDEGLGTSEIDKTEEEKLKEVSDVSNEDLASGVIDSSKDIISQDHTELKPEHDQVEEIPAEPEVSQPEKPVDTVVSPELATDGKETEEEEKDAEEKKMEDEPIQVLEEEKEPEVVKPEEDAAGAEESRESQTHLEDTTEKHESITEEVTQKEENIDEMPQHQVTEDTRDGVANGTDVNAHTENIESKVIDTNTNGDTDTKSSVDESSTKMLDNSDLESQPEEKAKEEESERPDQENQTRGTEVEEQAPTESTNGVSDEAKDSSEDSEQVVKFDEVPPKEEAAHPDESTSQDAVSVLESETDSETKTEQGSPAVVKPDGEKDSDSGSSSAADNSSLDLNLSISSFLSKSKEGGSVSLQVIYSIPHLHSYYQHNLDEP